MGSTTRSLLPLQLAIFTLLLNLVVGQANNPITRPQAGEVLHAGTTYNITWTPNTGDAIGIELWNGFSVAATLGANCDLDNYNPNCHQLITNMSNKGFYLWVIPPDAPTSDTYWLDIYVPDPGLYGPFYYMTGNFTVQKATNLHPLSSSASSASPVQAGAAAATTSSSGSIPAGAVGGIIGGVLGIALLACAITMFCLCSRRKRSSYSNRTRSIQLDSIPSGRTAEQAEGESMDEKEELQENSSFGRKTNAANGLRYMEDDEQWGLPSGRLQPTY